MTPEYILKLYIVLRISQHFIERWLASLNRQRWSDPKHQEDAMRILGISSDDMAKTLAYSRDKYAFGVVSGTLTTFAVLVFIVFGGLGSFGRLAAQIVGEGEIARGLVFFGLLAIAGSLLSLPFDWWHVFRLEAKHGFNRQTLRGFVSDKIKGTVLSVVLGGPLLAALLWVMTAAGNWWWVGAWVLLTFFSIFAAWMYPTLLAPLFNKFTPLPEGDLRKEIFALAEKTGFRASDVSIMDASKRSSHGNAYFTGVFGAKKIVLFDTLVQSMSPREVVAVLAHELGHFKLRHVRWGMIRGILTTGLMFWILSLLLPQEAFYRAFGFTEVSNWAALIVFSLWFGVFEFVFHPIGTWLSRRNEFAADEFARKAIGESESLAAALLKLREKSHAMPFSHPIYSAFYHSHPPMLERIQTLRAGVPAR